MNELEVEAVETASSDWAAVRRARLVARLLDDAVRIPGTDRRIGLDPLVGLLPVGGDALGAVLSLYVLVEGYRVGAPPRLLARMVLNVLVDFLVGIVPVVGDVFDAAWKANQRNVDLLASYVEG